MPSLDDYRHAHPDIRADFTIAQRPERYTSQEHTLWRRLCVRMRDIHQGRASQEYFDGLARLPIDETGIPDFERLSDALYKLTKWIVVPVPGLVPDDVFFEHLANRRFPAGYFIRRPEQFDYIEEPDVFHDVYGHVPLLAHPVFADYMEAYGKGGLRAMGFHSLDHLARLYWYTVEFGLIRNDAGLRVYGSGILSSPAETVYSIESSSPNRIHFDLERVMRTKYRIDDFQESYFVVDSFDELFSATYQDFAPLYRRLETGATYEAGTVLASDTVHTQGDHHYKAHSHQVA